MKSIKVVCAIIWKDDKVLIARRLKEKAMGGYWEFPGGKLENGESPEVALARELKEEMGMLVSIGKHLLTHTHDYGPFAIELIGYECEFLEATFRLTDHDEVVFVNPKVLLDYSIAPADLPFCDLLVRR